MSTRAVHKVHRALAEKISELQTQYAFTTVELVGVLEALKFVELRNAEILNEHSPVTAEEIKQQGEIEDALDGLEHVFPEDHSYYDRILWDALEEKYYDRYTDLYITDDHAKNIFGVPDR